MWHFLHPFLNPYNLSPEQIIFWVVLCVVVIPVAAWVTAKFMR